ncbi:hypothetical protein JCM17092_20990 [Haloplanus litoreus]
MSRSIKVVILDEVDQLEDPSVIYDLHSLPQFAIICIANKEEELFSRVDDRLVSRLRSSEHVRMDKYHDEQLYDILSARAKWGLDEHVITDDQFYRIADAAAGDARLAIGILRTGASRADRENQDRITNDILLDAAEDARAQIKQKSLDSLTPHQRVVPWGVQSIGREDIDFWQGRLADDLVDTATTTLVFVEREATPRLLVTLSIQLHLAGRSLSNTVPILEVFGVERARSTVHNWVHKADLQPEEDRSPGHVAVDETVIRLNDEQYWLYAAVDPETNEFSTQRVNRREPTLSLTRSFVNYASNTTSTTPCCSSMARHH